MTRFVLGVVLVALTALGRPAVAAETDEQLKAKLEAVRKQIEELKRKERDLAQRLATPKPYVKVEVRGVLVNEEFGFPNPVLLPGGKRLAIAVGEERWGLSFKDDATTEQAKGLAGKTVVVTGTLGTRLAIPFPPGPPLPPVVAVETLRAAE